MPEIVESANKDRLISIRYRDRDSYCEFDSNLLIFNIFLISCSVAYLVSLMEHCLFHDEKLDSNLL